MLGYRLVKEATLEAQCEQLQQAMEERALAAARLEESRAHAQTSREFARVAQGKADQAEAMVRLQAKTIERLMATNERMVVMVGDMRRVGFAILTEEELDTKETPATTADYDREAVEQNPELGADPE